MKSLRRSTLGGVLAAFVYFASACATGNEEPRVGFDEDAGAADAAKGGTAVIVPKDSGGVPDEATGGPACDGKVVVNEVMTAGATAADEFVELYNPGSCAVPMSGWKLSYRSSSGNPTALVTFPTGTSIPSKAFLVIGGSGFTGKKADSFTNGLAAGDGQVAILDDKGKVIDGVAYGMITANAATGTYQEKASAPSPAANGSIARKTDGVDTDDNSADFAKAAKHSAGAPNP